MIATLPQPDTFRTQPIRGLPEAAKVDRSKRTIYGAKAMEMGPLNEGDARPWKVDIVTLQQLQQFVNAKNTGVKMRFAHPNMSRDGMGRHVGRASNARIVGEGDLAYVAIDARVSDTNLQYSDHVLDLAESAPEDFGLSIAPLLDRAAMDKITPDANGLTPIRLKSLQAIDFVDQPAATRGGLFELDSDSIADLPAQATHLLDTFFSDSPADVIRARFGEFLNTYLQTRGDDVATETKPIEQPTEPVTQFEAVPVDTKEAARLELQRRSEITALCQLAKVSDEDRELMFRAGFSRAEAQDWLKSSGKLGANNPPITEGTAAEPAKKTDDEKFAAEWDEFSDIYQRQGISKEQYVASRKLG